MKILVVDDETIALKSIKRLLNRRGFKDVEVCDNGRDAIAIIKEGDFDIVLLDFIMENVNGIKVLEETRAFKPHTEFIMLTALDDVSTAIKAIRLGAYDYLIKPADEERLVLSIEHAYEHKGLHAGLAGAHAGRARVEEVPECFSEIITQDPRMMELISYAQVMARSSTPILITGESGTGKELLARGIHRAGNNPDGPFTAVNVSSVPETLFESQFFGHIKGAFTGAEKDFAGYFEQSNGGTLFLDEIGELSLNLQVKLLRALEEKTITRLGDESSIQVDVRIVSATNNDLDKACQEGKFRLDLMYRLKSVFVHLPPLRERGGDIPLIARHVLKNACIHSKKEVHDFSPESMEVLLSRDFPGNIRELKQLVENAVFLADSPVILPDCLGNEQPSSPSFARRMCSLKENYETHLVYVLNHSNGNRAQTAQILGITVRQLQRKLAQMKKDPRWKSFLDDL